MVHIPVLLHEAIQALAIQPSGTYVDATFGRGGHTRAILNHLASDGCVWVMDRDPTAIASARAHQAQDPRIHIEDHPFSYLYTMCEQAGCLQKVQGILLDLGVSSPQLNVSERGFSFQKDGPLDMRMDPRSGESAATWLAQVEEAELIRVLKEYGEERFARRIAAAIINARTISPVTSTTQLAAIVSRAIPCWEPHKHPATRTFQAIRIAINRELEELEKVLKAALDVLAVGGRLVVISFHSLEDRIVKRFIQNQEQGMHAYPKGIPMKAVDICVRLKRVGQKIRAHAEECALNPRARSAVLRVAEKVAL
jgi:16S rRNA (cytosine1402-N4)-methyltransferase